MGTYIHMYTCTLFITTMNGNLILYRMLSMTKPNNINDNNIHHAAGKLQGTNFRVFVDFDLFIPSKIGIRMKFIAA